LPETTTHWVFGYGSLMWNPGFPHLRAVPALLKGYHRKLCVYSFHYRGRPEKPGLVFGLDRGGSCRGVAFEVAPADWENTHAYLQKREQITMVYKEATKKVRLLPQGDIIPVLTYVVDRQHPQCACSITDEDVLRLVRQGIGEAGGNVEYVRNTQARLAALGMSDPKLARIVKMLA
jgi:glutathione-specific gamma-glutamylcyclotransferase